EQLATAQRGIDKASSPSAGVPAPKAWEPPQPGDGDDETRTTSEGGMEKASSPSAGTSATQPGDGGAATRTAANAWPEVLEKLNRTVRAAYLDAQPEVDGSPLVLWFRY